MLVLLLDRKCCERASDVFHPFGCKDTKILLKEENLSAKSTIFGKHSIKMHNEGAFDYAYKR